MPMLPCVLCGKEISAQGGRNTFFYAGKTYACCTGGCEHQGAYDDDVVIARIQQQSQEARRRSELLPSSKQSDTHQPREEATTQCSNGKLASRGIFNTWRFRISWIACASLVGAALVTGTHEFLQLLISDSFIPLIVSTAIALIVAIAIHIWVVWYGLWRWDGPVLDSYRKAAWPSVILIAVGLPVISLSIYYGNWIIASLVTFAWLLIHPLPSRLINVRAQYDFLVSHKVGTFCTRCGSPMVLDNRFMGYSQQVDYGEGRVARTSSYGGHKCLVCGSRS